MSSLSVMKSGKESTSVVGRGTFGPENENHELGEEPHGRYQRLGSD